MAGWLVVSVYLPETPGSLVQTRVASKSENKQWSKSNSLISAAGQMTVESGGPQNNL